MISVGKVLVILRTKRTSAITTLDLVIFTDDKIVKGIAKKLPMIEPNMDILIVSISGATTLEA